MGKQRKMGRTKTKSREASEKLYEDNDTTLDPSARSFVYDQVDDFHDSREEALLREVTFKKPKSIDKEYVLGVGGSSDSDDDGADYEDSDEDQMYMEDDIVDEKVETLPDDRAWGKKKHLYFHTDTSDERLRRIVQKGKANEFAQLEGAAARKFQERLDAEVQDLPEDDLFIKAVTKEKQGKHDLSKLHVDGDLSLLSHKEKKRLLKQQSPEFFLIVKDFEEKSNELTNILTPLMEARKAGKLTHLNLDRYITTRYQVLSNYVTNICAYFVLKCDNSNLSQHPVITRLTQYRNILKQLDVIHDSLIPRLEELVASWKSKKCLDLPHDPAFEQSIKKPRKLLGILGNDKNIEDSESEDDLSKMLDDSDDDDNTDGEYQTIPKQQLEEERSEEEISDMDTNANEDEDERRGITKEMSKNKGLIPSRRRDQQNPRVKYRMKYSKKLKLRKGQVRQVRKEVHKYTGEKSGINVRAIKSVKMK